MRRGGETNEGSARRFAILFDFAEEEARRSARMRNRECEFDGFICSCARARHARSRISRESRINGARKSDLTAFAEFARPRISRNANVPSGQVGGQRPGFGTRRALRLLLARLDTRRRRSSRFSLPFCSQGKTRNGEAASSPG